MDVSISSFDRYNFVTPRVHGLVYNHATGQLKKLSIDWRQEKEKYSSIYDLYPKYNM